MVHRVMSPVGALRYPLVIGRVWVFERLDRSCECSHVSFSMALCLTSSDGRGPASDTNTCLANTLAFNAASQCISLMRCCIHRMWDSPILLLTYSPVLACTPLPNATRLYPACQSSSTHGTSRNPFHAQTHFHRIRQEDRAGSSPFGVCLYLQDGSSRRS